MSALNYARMPGPGDLWHEPDCEPAFGLDDAAGNVAAYLTKHDEVGELVDEVAEAAGVLRWISHNAEIPFIFCAQFGSLIAQAERLERMRAAEYTALNGG